MSKVKIIFALSIWITLLSFLGFPYSLKSVLFTISGLGLVFVNFMLFRDLKAGEIEEKTFDNFSENNNFNENETVIIEEISDLSKEEK
jgi:hypothetical protein